MVEQRRDLHLQCGPFARLHTRLLLTLLQYVCHACVCAPPTPTHTHSPRYVLAYLEQFEGMRRGDRIWQLGFGSGFKCNSAVWRANRRFKVGRRRGAAWQAWPSRAAPVPWWGQCVHGHARLHVRGVARVCLVWAGGWLGVEGDILYKRTEAAAFWGGGMVSCQGGSCGVGQSAPLFFLLGCA